MDLITKILDRTGLSYRSLALCITREYHCPTTAQGLQQVSREKRKSIRLPLLIALNKMMNEYHPELGSDWVLGQVAPGLRSK